MPQFLASDFRSLLDAIADPQDSAPVAKPSSSTLLTELARKQPLKEGPMTKQQIIDILAGFRKTAKGSEMVNSPPLPDSFANQLANGLWEVISWLQAQPDAAPPAAAPAAPAPAPAAPAATAPLAGQAQPYRG